MTARTHLFVAPGNAAFGEVLLGLRIARELHAAGDRVMFLAPHAHRILFKGTPFDHGAIDRVTTMLDRALPDVIRAKRCDTIVLLDLMIVMLVLARTRIDPSFLDRLGIPTFALDIWDLRRSNLRFDMCDADYFFAESARTVVPNRLVPVPFARPDVEGAYCALPEVGDGDRRAIRAELGLADDERLVMVTTAKFQTLALTPFQKEIVATVPKEIVGACLECDPRVRVLHVGPGALAPTARYRHEDQLPPARYEQLLRASDLLLTANQAATGITTALALGVLPVAVIGESTRYPFRVFPLGLHAFMAPALEDNPYTSVVPAIDVARLREEIRPHVFDEDLRAARCIAIQEYLAVIRRLPRASELVSRA